MKIIPFVAAIWLTPIVGCGGTDAKFGPGTPKNSTLEQLIAKKLTPRPPESRFLDLLQGANLRIQIEGETYDFLAGGSPKYVAVSLADSKAGPVVFTIADGKATVRAIPKPIWEKSWRELEDAVRLLDGKVLNVESTTDASWWFLKFQRKEKEYSLAFRGVSRNSSGDMFRAWLAWNMLMSFSHGEWVLPERDSFPASSDPR